MNPNDPNDPFNQDWTKKQNPNQQQNWNQNNTNQNWNQNNPNWNQQQNQQWGGNQQQWGGQPNYNNQGAYIPPYNPNLHATNMELQSASTAQVCGIIGIILFWNIIGIVLNIVAIVQGGSAIREYNMNPSRYSPEAFRKAKAGRTCGIVGLCLIPAAIVIVFIIAVLVNL